MKLKRVEVLVFLFQIVTIILSLAVIICISRHTMDTFVAISGYGTVITIINMVLLCILQGKIINSINIVYLSYCLFQLGLPMLYAIAPNFNSLYIDLFDAEVLCDATIYTIFSIQVFAVGVSVGIVRNRKRRRKASLFRKISIKFENNKEFVKRAAACLFVIVAVVFLSEIGKIAIAAIQEGRFSFANRSLASASAILRLAKECFFSSALLFFIFNDQSNHNIVVIIPYCIGAIMMLTIGDRTFGLTALVVLLLYYALYKNTNKNKLLQYALLVFGGVLAGYVLVFVAQYRLGNSIAGWNIKEILTKLISELGFTFTSMCFTRELAPSQYPFLNGSSYWVTIPLLVPKVFDIFHLNQYLMGFVGEQWLDRNLGGRFDFGVGYTVTAEAYLNFSWYGLIVLFVLGVIVSTLLNEETNITKWQLYVKLVMLMFLLIMPRHSFYSLVKSLEYSVGFIMLYLLFFIWIFKKGKH